MGGMKALRMWSLDPENRKVRPMEVSTRKEVRTYTCIAVALDDTVLYRGTTTGDVMVVSAEKQTLITQAASVRRSAAASGDRRQRRRAARRSGDGEPMTLDLGDPGRVPSACRRSSARCRRSR